MRQSHGHRVKKHRTQAIPTRDPETHDLPTASNDYFTYARKLRSEGYQWAFQQETNSRRPGGKVPEALI